MKRKALITGATGGLGREFAILLSHKGYELILVARNEKKLQELIKSLNNGKNKHQYIVCDLNISRDLEKLTKTYPDVDLLVNNAGFSDYGYYPQLSWDKQKEMISVNCVALSFLCHYYLKNMLKKNRGQILNVASTAGTNPGPFASTYTGTKAYVIQFSKSLALELRGTNVTVSCLLPGPIATEFWQKAGMEDRVVRRLDKFDKPNEVAEYGLGLLEQKEISGIYGLKNRAKELIKTILPENIWFYLIRRHMLPKVNDYSPSPDVDNTSL